MANVMRKIDTGVIRDKIADMSVEACIELNSDLIDVIKKSEKEEIDPLGKKILGQLLENSDVALAERLPLCQDTGMVTVFMEIGQDVHLIGEPLYEMIQEGVRRGYAKGYLRKSIVSDPLDRVNTGDNTPAVVHCDIVLGDKVSISVLPKGAGCENMCKVAMLKPSDGEEGVKKFVVDTVAKAGANACPPMIIGVGLGGSFEKVAYLAKKALMLPFKERSEKQHIAALEDQLLEQINELNIGPQGFGGRTTAMGLRIMEFPTHIASLPVAVNISCHVLRYKKVDI